MGDYVSKHFSCEEMDQRMLQGWYDDVKKKGYTGTKEEFDSMLARGIPEVVQELGTGPGSEKKVISQKIVTSEIEKPYKVYASNMQTGYYADLTNAQLGDVRYGLALIPNEPTHTFRSIQFYAPLGSIITISGLGGSNASRLYCAISKKTNTIVHLAEKGENTLNSPKKIILTEDCDVYLTFYDTKGYVNFMIPTKYITNAIENSFRKSIAHFQYYAVVLTPPEMDTRAKTFTIKNNTQFLYLR